MKRSSIVVQLKPEATWEDQCKLDDRLRNLAALLEWHPLVQVVFVDGDNSPD